MYIISSLLIFAGCEPGQQIDIYEISIASDLATAEIVFNKRMHVFPDANPYPFKVKANCGSKNTDQSIIFYCLDSGKYFVGAGITTIKMNERRDAFAKLINEIKTDFDKSNVKYSVVYKQNISKTDFEKLYLYYNQK